MLLQAISLESLKNDGLSLSLIDKIIDMLLDNTILLAQKIVLVLIVFVIGRWLVRKLRQIFTRFLERKKVEKTVRSFLDNVASITLNVFLFIFIVNILGVSTTSFAAIIAAAGLAVGMSMKDNLSNFAGGVMLLINKPFRVGHRIFAQGVDGVVQSIGILYTILLTGDNRTIYVPNGPLSTGNIINYSNQPDRRIDIVLNVNYGVNVEDLKTTIFNIIDSEKRILQTPSAPFVGVTNLSNGNIDITVRAWVNTNDYSIVNVYLNEKIYEQFSQKGVYSTAILNVKMLN